MKPTSGSRVYPTSLPCFLFQAEPWHPQTKHPWLFGFYSSSRLLCFQYIDSCKNAMNKGYKLAVNEFADLTNKEFRTARNRFKAHECSPSTTAFRYENLTAFPSSMDWRKKGADVAGNFQLWQLWKE
ncbi:Peptidase C1A, papain [Cynara cardunculus var. scolymus]|uniref:Peptidase C1A, papain n=1 Tax=Cynara cardunculus var. scolymus TaxID=59895 RepID=A0A103XS98_CYNCS|nr:Peptidase C1A, papain [Cynara cardunculus var. scolymus]